ncbi:glycosyltransferase [Isoptericola sp. NPDC056605]|uniref:glycosyltransferase n=1 Tax=Isoptericola sp. NPDC056605 TaxID=3345876 RepID=UPI0036C94B49
MRTPVIGSGALGALAMIVVAFADLSVTSVALAVGSLALTATVCAVVMRAARQIHRAQVRTEQLIIENHKRASVWNHHLKEAGVGGHGRGGSQAAATVTRSTSATSSWKDHAQAARLARSGAFDAEHYAALVGATFDSPIDAASHYLNLNAAKGVMPSPFLDRTFLPSAVTSALARGDAKPLLAFLRSPKAFERPLSELFDARYSDVSPEAAGIHPGGVLGAFFEGVTESTELALADDSVISGARVATVRRALVQHGVRYYAGAPSTEPREQSTWDHDAEIQWLGSVRATAPGPLPSVSVIMPVKDRAGCIEAAIASVQRQTHGNWHLVVVDDGSTDDTASRVRAMAERDARITLLQNDGAGVSAARNTGLDASAGEYIAFLDSDNEWREHFLETSLHAMTTRAIGAAYAAVAIGDDKGGVRYRAFAGGLDQLRLLNHIDLNVFVVRSDVIADVRFDETLRRWVDHDFAIKVATRTSPELLPFIGCEYDHSTEAVDRITVKESEHWQWAVLGRHWVDWESTASTVAGRLSVVVPTYNDHVMTARAVTSVLRDADAWGVDVEVVVVDNGSRIEIGQQILAGVGAADRVRYHRLPRNLNFAIGCNVGVVAATGEHVLFLNNDTVVRSGTLVRLLGVMDRPDVIGAQPVLVYDDETIQTAGSVFSTRNSFPSHLLTGHPPADAASLDGVELDAVTAAALVMRTDDVRSLRGFDPIFVNGMEDVDLCLRAREAFGGHFTVVPTALVTHLESKTPGRGNNVDENRRIFLERWSGMLPGPQDTVYERCGFAVAHVGTDGRAVPGPKPVIVRNPEDRRTRWGIKIASIPGERGDQWGDTHFAESLRVALEDQGQTAVVHRHGAHSTPASSFDDVVLVVRGIDRVRPMPGKLNILWVISHPDKVTIDEIREFDLVFAASVPWAAKMSAASGRDVVPLLQATDIRRFNTSVEPVQLGVPLFVGGVHPGRERPVVEAALGAGVDLAVIGPGWGDSLPAGVHRGHYVDNEELAAYYRGASKVLADHWGTMSAEGFIQNRVFDAVAAGCRVVSDPVDGLDETFMGAVRTYDSPDDLTRLCGDDAGSEFPSEAEMDKIAAAVRENHSFQKRAKELVSAASSVR